MCHVHSFSVHPPLTLHASTDEPGMNSAILAFQLRACRIDCSCKQLVCTAGFAATKGWEWSFRNKTQVCGCKITPLQCLWPWTWRLYSHNLSQRPQSSQATCDGVTLQRMYVLQTAVFLVVSRRFECRRKWSGPKVLCGCNLEVPHHLSVISSESFDLVICSFVLSSIYRA